MSREDEIVRQIKLGSPVDGAKILERRTRGLSLIRQHFLARFVKHAGVQAESSLGIRWRGLGEYANARTLVDATYELVLHDGARAISGKFPDVWVLCYPLDPEIKAQVETVLEQMCAQAAERP